MEALVLSTLLLVVDWGQTRAISVAPPWRTETNRILGRKPSLNRVDAYFSAAIIGNALISTGIKSKKCRRAYDFAVSATEVKFVFSNHKLGVRMHWQF